MRENSPDRLLTRLRRIGDEHTWTIPLDTVGVTPSPTPDSVLDVCTFRMNLPVMRGFPVEYYTLDVTTKFCHPVPEHSYSTSHFKDDGLDPYYLNIVQLSDRIGDATVIDTAKMDEEK